jgi:aspartate ammonia-lyase
MQSGLSMRAAFATDRNLALEMNRISYDLRLLTSARNFGLAEIELSALRPQAWIMREKIKL